MRVIAASPEWMAQGECRGMDPDIFITERGQSLERAKRTCEDCRVAQECLDYAIEHPWLQGVWGGLSGRERRSIRRRRRAEAVAS